MSDQFDYVALDPKGMRHTGTLVAPGVDDVADRIRRMGLRPVAVTEHRKSMLQAELKVPFIGNIGAAKRTRNELAVFSRQLATMVSAGLPLLRCLSTLSHQTESVELRAVLNQVALDVGAGERFSASLAVHSEWFDAFYISMIQAGEAAGDLDNVLIQLAETTEKSADLRRKIRAALTYPIAIASLAGLIVLAMLLFLVPTMKKIFADLHGALPLPTRIVITLSDPLVKTIPFAGHTSLLSSLMRAAVLVGIVTAIRRLFRRWASTEAGRWKLDSTKLKMPVFGELLERTALARFSRSMSVLIRSGIPILDALRIAEDVVTNEVLARAVRASAADVKAGVSLGAALSEHPVFPPMITQMVGVGEETGELAALLDKLAEFYEAEVSAKVESLTALLEPMMLVFMGATIGGMVISLYLPMFKVVSLIK